MKRVLVLLENNFQDHEFSGPVLSLQKSGIETSIASHKRGVELTGRHRTKALSNLSYSEVNCLLFDALFIPGGGSPANVRKFPEAIKITRQFSDDKKPIAAICHGPQVLATAGVLKNKIVTCWPKIANEIKAAGAKYVNKEVVVDHNLITSRSPYDVPAFVNQLLKALA